MRIKNEVPVICGAVDVMTQRFLQKLCCYSEGLGGCFHTECLVGSAVILEVDPISDCSCCMLNAFKAMPMDALLFNCADDTFDHSVLLWAMRGYELLFQAVAANQTCVVATGKNEAIIRAQKEGVLNLSK